MYVEAIAQNYSRVPISTVSLLKSYGVREEPLAADSSALYRSDTDVNV